MLTRIFLGATLALLLALPAAAEDHTVNVIATGTGTFAGGTLSLRLEEHLYTPAITPAYYVWQVHFVGSGFDVTQKNVVSCGQNPTGSTNPSYNTVGCTVAGEAVNTPGIPGGPLYLETTVYKAGTYGPLGWAKVTLFQTGCPGAPRTILAVVYGKITAGGFTIGPGIQPL